MSFFRAKYIPELYIIILKPNSMSKKSNHRADVKNPNNTAYKAAQDNTSNQLNPNHSATKADSNSATVNAEGTKSK